MGVHIDTWFYGQSEKPTTVNMLSMMQTNINIGDTLKFPSFTTCNFGEWEDGPIQDAKFTKL